MDHILRIFLLDFALNILTCFGFAICDCLWRLMELTEDFSTCEAWLNSSPDENLSDVGFNFQTFTDASN